LGKRKRRDLNRSAGNLIEAFRHPTSACVRFSNRKNHESMNHDNFVLRMKHVFGAASLNFVNLYTMFVSIFLMATIAIFLSVLYYSNVV